MLHGAFDMYGLVYFHTFTDHLPYAATWMMVALRYASLYCVGAATGCLLPRHLFPRETRAMI